MTIHKRTSRSAVHLITEGVGTGYKCNVTENRVMRGAGATADPAGVTCEACRFNRSPLEQQAITEINELHQRIVSIAGKLASSGIHSDIVHDLINARTAMARALTKLDPRHA